MNNLQQTLNEKQLNNNFKIPKIYMFPGYVYMTYKQNGFIKGTINVYNYLKIEFIGYLYRHCKWFNKFLTNRAKGEGQLILLDLVYGSKDWSLKNAVNKYPEFREFFINNFEQLKEDSCNKIIKEHNITDKNEIQKIKDSFKLEDYVENS